MSAGVFLERISELEDRYVRVQKAAAVQVHELEMSAARLGGALEGAQDELRVKDEEILSLRGQLSAAERAHEAVVAQLREKEDALDQEVVRSNYLRGDLAEAQRKGEAEIVRLQSALEEKTRERDAMARELHEAADLLTQERMRSAHAEQNRQGERKEWDGTRDEWDMMLVQAVMEQSACASQADRQADALQRAQLDNGDLRRELSSIQARLVEQTRALAQKDVSDEDKRLRQVIKKLKKGTWWLVIRAIVSKTARSRLEEQKKRVEQLRVGLKN